MYDEELTYTYPDRFDADPGLRSDPHTVNEYTPAVEIVTVLVEYVTSE
jgi:hypothetical protein